MDQVRVRFAPSPTGYLHIGGARTALYNWLFARKHQGTFILRIEDTDAERSTSESINEILDGLTWLGITWDEGPYFQSERIQSHRDAARRLLESGHAYQCFCTKQDLESKRERALREKIDYKYDGTCRRLSAAEVREREQRGLPSVVRFKTPQSPGSVAFDDIVYGHIEKQHADIEDFVILRSDGNPMYLLSNAVDDMTDRITHVLRGQDGLGNTPKQLLIYRALGCAPPAFAHMSLTLDTKKAKISKRKHGDVVTVAYYRQHGFLPWALCNFLALLGWSSSDDREFFTRDELIQAFGLEGIARHNSIFNYVPGDPKNWTDPKAINMNARYISTVALEDLLPRVREELQSAGLWSPAYENERQAWLASTVSLLRTRVHTLKDFSSKGRPYFADDYPYEPEAVARNLACNPDLKQHLDRAAEVLQACEPFDLEHVEQAVRTVCQELAIKPGLLINAIRTATTGQATGPGLFDIMVALGKHNTVGRIRRAMALF